MIEAAFELLKLSHDATPEEARAAWVRLVRRYPPEHFPEKFASVCRAYRQVSLDEDFIEEACQRLNEGASPLRLAVFLWGDRKDVTAGGEAEVDLRSLKTLLSLERTRQALDGLLETASARGIEWRK